MNSTDPLLQKMSALLQREGVLANRRRKPVHILVAFSGGADSTALLYGLHLLRAESKLRLSALYVNHGLRTASVLKTEEEGCRRLCCRLEIPFCVKGADVRAISRKNKISLELAGRTLRYELLAATASELNADLIATGHHQDDQIETVLFRLFRGGWLDSLAGIPFRRENIIRPLLQCTKSEILTFLKRSRLRYSTDTTNDDLQFSRNRIRHDLLPRLRAIQPNLDESLLGYARQAQAFAEEMQSETNEFFTTSASMTPGGKLLVDRQRFTSLSPLVSQYHAREGVARIGGKFHPVSTDQMEQVVRLAHGEGKVVNLTGGLHVHRLDWKGSPTGISDLLAFVPPPGTQSPVRVEKLKAGFAKVFLFDGATTLTCTTRRGKRTTPGPQTALLDRDAIQFPLTVRPWVSGDRYVPLGMTGTKKIGDYLTDKKFPVLLRDEQLVVEDSLGIIWLVGHTIADRVKVKAVTRQFLTLSYTLSAEKS